MLSPAAARMPATLVQIGIAVAAGCTNLDAGTEPLQAEHEVRGDTVVVRTIAGSRWGREARLQRVAELEPEAAAFREVTGLAVGDGGLLLVYDRRLRALMVYSADGVRQLAIGGESAPVDSDGGVAALPDGDIVVRDPAARRLVVYSEAGTRKGEWPLQSEVRTELPLYQDHAGNIYTFAWLDGAGSERTRALIPYAPGGTVLDTLQVPERPAALLDLVASRGGLKMELALPYAALPTWTFSPRGYFVAGPADRYVVDLLVRGDSVVRIERAVPPVAVGAGERQAEQARIAAEFRDYFPQWQWPDTVEIPAVKPAYRAILAGRDGRIWVQRSVASDRVGGEWSEPVVYDVFEHDGTYLGAVATPAGFRTTPQPRIAGDSVLAVVGDDDAQRVVLFEIRR